MPIPVIHCGHLLHARAEFGVGKLDQPEGDLGIASELAVAADVGLGDGVAGAFVQQLGREREILTWRDERAQLGFLQRGEERHAREVGDGNNEPA